MKFVQAVRNNIDDIARILTMEQGKPLWQAKGEVNGFCAVIQLYAQEARRITGMVLQSDIRDKFVYVLRHPMGVIAAIPMERSIAFAQPHDRPCNGRRLYRSRQAVVGIHR